MKTLPIFEKAEAYLCVHLAHAGPGPEPFPTGPFITISRESGIGGLQFAEMIAARLAAKSGEPWTVYSGNLIEEMLRTNGLPRHLARFLPEDRISEIDATIGEIVGLHPNLWSLVAKTNELIRRLALAGHAILLGRGGNFATARLAHGVHLRLVAPAHTRAERTARVLGCDRGAAAACNAARDAARQRYVRANFSADIASPTSYDLVLNTDRLSCAWMIAAVERLVDIRTGGMVYPKTSHTGLSSGGSASGDWQIGAHARNEAGPASAAAVSGGTP